MNALTDLCWSESEIYKHVGLIVMNGYFFAWPLKRTLSSFMHPWNSPKRLLTNTFTITENVGGIEAQ